MVHDRAGRGREVDVDVDVDVESGTSLPLAHRDICFWLERVTGLAGPCPRATPPFDHLPVLPKEPFGHLD